MSILQSAAIAGFGVFAFAAGAVTAKFEIAFNEWKEARQRDADPSRADILTPEFCPAPGKATYITWQEMLENLPSDRVKLCMADYRKNITKAKKSKKKHSHWQDKLNRCQAELLRRESSFAKGEVANG